VTAPRRWQPFDRSHLDAMIGRVQPPWKHAGEQVCPACGARALRYFAHPGERFGRPILFSYRWCANCRRFTGATGPRPDGLTFTEPLSRQEIDETDGVSGLLDLLDRMWDEGTLPQSFTMSGRGLR